MRQTYEAMTRNLKWDHQEVLSLLLIFDLGLLKHCPKQYVSAEIQRMIGNFHVESPGFKLQSGLELMQADGTSSKWQCIWMEMWRDMLFINVYYRI